jgi:cobalt-zinc-cadmium efflux system protein
VTQVVAGIGAHSVGLLADAGHNLADVAAVSLALVAVRMSTRRPTAERSFGFHRSTVLAAQANAGAVLTVSVFILYAAVRRLQHPVPVHSLVVAAVAAVALVANLGAAAGLHDGRADLNVRAAMLHLLGDALASLGVAISGLVMFAVHGAYWLDPLVSIAIAVLIAIEAVRLLRAATEVLLEATPGGLDMADVARVIRQVPGVEDVHDLHAWSLSSEVRALSAHVVMSGHPTLEEAQAVADVVKGAIAAPFSISHATLELECETCVDPCAMEDLVVDHGAHRH